MSTDDHGYGALIKSQTFDKNFVGKKERELTDYFKDDGGCMYSYFLKGDDLQRRYLYIL